MKLEQVIPEEVMRRAWKFQAVFGILLIIPWLVLLMYLAEQYTHLLAVLLVAVVGLGLAINYLLNLIKVWVILTAAFFDLHSLIELLCMKDEGFEEFFEKHSNGFTQEEAERIVNNYERSKAANDSNSK